MATGSPTRDRQTPDVAERADGRPARERRADSASTLDYWLGDAPAERDPSAAMGDASIDAQLEGTAERLANWSVAFLASLVASLSLLGGAWALGLVG